MSRAWPIIHWYRSSSKDLFELSQNKCFKGTWRKEDELHSVKSELAAFDRQMQLSLRPIVNEDTQKEQPIAENMENNVEPPINSEMLNLTTKSA